MMKKQCLFSLSAILLTVATYGQLPRTDSLFLAMKKQDSVFFERSFNRCDFAYLEKAVHRDLVFYHDQGGIQDRNRFLDNVRMYICGDTTRKPIRKVIESSLEVYPMYSNGVLYGVVQHGSHEFYIREPNKPDLLTSRAQFTHLYLLDQGNWVLKEVLSFDHQDPGQRSPDRPPGSR